MCGVVCSSTGKDIAVFWLSRLWQGIQRHLHGIGYLLHYHTLVHRLCRKKASEVNSFALPWFQRQGLALCQSHDRGQHRNLPLLAIAILPGNGNSLELQSLNAFGHVARDHKDAVPVLVHLKCHGLLHQHPVGLCIHYLNLHLALLSRLASIGHLY